MVLILKDVLFRHTEFSLLSDFLAEKYGFSKIEEETREVSKSRKKISTEPKTRNSEEGIEGQTIWEENRKYSMTKILSGNYLDAEIRVCILGEVIHKEDCVEIDAGERFPVYTTEYQMVKLVSASGYAIAQLIERLSLDLGLKIGSRHWFFHRCRDA